ncbi:GW dipeptide domain-containing protein [Liquorilactobacillus nagelii]|uniref:GW dipeptide domain-containing protein n=1 Tax=Liquorilactobacillus nagelii TaxID=82688 RepID=UPI0021C3CB10|nr:GW dipeptide domain-containing protein [Liquorilactobacillus nagelii]MCP9316132.1 SH3-like domain-containing protein [Liquorilactobacillus nagelii]
MRAIPRFLAPSILKSSQRGKFAPEPKKEVLPDFAKVTHSDYKTVYRTISRDTDIFSAPAGTDGAKKIGNTSSLKLKNTTVTLTQVLSNGRTYVRISQIGKTIGFIDIAATVQTLGIKSSKSSTWWAVITKAGDLRQNVTQTAHTSTASLKSKNVTIKQRVVLTDGSTWLLCSQNNKVIGWVNQSSFNKTIS